MVMSPPIKHWEAADKELLSFFGLSFSHTETVKPLFGSFIRVPQLEDGLTETFQSILGEEGGYSLPKQERKSLTTLLNLACYFGYTEWGRANLQKKDVDPRLILLLLKYAQHQFFQERIRPLRNYLWNHAHPMYLYCLPATSLETHPMTGELFRSEGPPVLCILPKSPAVAHFYEKTEAEIQILAGQVMWLIRRLCDVHRIKEPAQLREAADGWGEYINPLTMIIQQEKFQRDTPHLITSESRQALLSKAALELLRVNAPVHEELE